MTLWSMSALLSKRHASAMPFIRSLARDRNQSGTVIVPGFNRGRLRMPAPQ